MLEDTNISIIFILKFSIRNKTQTSSPIASTST